MFLIFSAILFSIVFAFGLEAIVYSDDYLYLIFSVLLLISLFGIKVVTKKWSVWFLALVFVSFSVTMLWLIDTSIEKHIFIFLDAIVYYFMLLAAKRMAKNIKDETARSILAAVIMAIIFLFFSASYGIYLNFTIASWLLMLFYFAVISIVSYQYFLIVNPDDKKKVATHSMIIGFAMMQIAWIINFWPFGYLTTGIILLMAYFVFWDLTQNYFLDNLSRKRVVVNLFIFVAISGMILSTSRWFLIV